VKRLPILALAGLCLAAAACDNMANQPKRLPNQLPYGVQANWPMQPPFGVVANDEPFGPPPMPPVTLALLERGRQRFDIYCSPCHARAGDGQGMIYQRGFPKPPSFFSKGLIRASNQHFYDVITHGHGVMFPYAARVAPPDRWAIIAYIRALQASENATIADVPTTQRQLLQ
jgi:mono/diheme cytochrome c family protein